MSVWPQRQGFATTLVLSPQRSQLHCKSNPARTCWTRYWRHWCSWKHLFGGAQSLKERSHLFSSPSGKLEDKALVLLATVSLMPTVSEVGLIRDFQRIWAWSDTLQKMDLVARTEVEGVCRLRGCLTKPYKSIDAGLVEVSIYHREMGSWVKIPIRHGRTDIWPAARDEGPELREVCADGDVRTRVTSRRDRV